MGKKKLKDRFANREAEKYSNPIPSREFIIELLAELGHPATFSQLKEELRLDTVEQKEALRRRLIAMVRDGQLIQNRRGAYGPLDKMEVVAGRVIGHKDGYGFVTADDGGDDFFINARQMRTVFPDDRVLVRTVNVDQRGRREGAIAEVLEHNTHEVVGRLMMEDGSYYIQPTNTRITQDILVSADNLRGATPGQMVVVTIVVQPSATERAAGQVKEILGDHMAPGMEIDVAIRNHELPHEWPEDTLQEASRFSKDVPTDALKGRFDAREMPFVTIDGEDAKDFDDAVFCRPKKGGGWMLYVAIADVSHYVKLKSALDREALNRGNSVYFPGRVIPMLPEVLSNGLCSLNPHVDRLTMVCEMAISSTGKITQFDFYESVIRSQARLTYNQVYDMIEKKDAALQKKFAELVPHLEELFSVYRVLHKARTKRGAIDFDLPETKIIFGEDRKIERIVALERNDAHRLIEECMLCANICAARFLLKNDCPGLYRIHEGPTAEKLIDLRKFLGEVGLKLPGSAEPTPRDYAKLLDMVGDRPDAHIIQTVLLRSLKQAIYSPENKGHFGLAFDAYTHFTSPIRRYPDLVVHRSIRRILRRDFEPGEFDPIYEKYGEHCSMTERRADDATREAMDWLKCEFMMDKVGKDFDGVISSVTSFGIFVELAEIYVEGLVHISMLPNDYYHYDPLKHEMRGEHSRQAFRLGDPVKVKVARVDLDQRQMDFVLVEEERPAASAKKSKKKKKK